MSIVTQLVQIILRKRAPSDLQFSISAAVLVTVSMFALRSLAFSTVPLFSQPLAYALVYTLANVLVVFAVLRMHNKQARFVQTITALLGVSVILQFMAVFALSSGLLAFTGVMILIWYLYLLVVIMREALDCSTVKAILVTLAYNFVMSVILSLSFPGLEGELDQLMQYINDQAQSMNQAAAQS